MNWDLTPLFKNYDEVDRSLLSSKKSAKKFAKKYKEKLSTLKSEEFNKALDKYESIIEDISRVLSFVFLQFATDSSKGSIMAKYELECNKIEEDLLFFELEFGKLDSKTQKKFIKKAGVKSYYLQNLAESKKHMLSLQEERVLLKKEPVGSSAFSRLFDEHLSGLAFEFKGEKLAEEQVLSKLHDSKRDIRKAAAKSLTQGLEPHTKLLGYILNQVKKDWAIECDLRGYSSPEEPRHKANRITQKSVDALIDSVNSKMPLVHRYYEAKKKLLRIKELYEYDRYAPIRQKSRDYSFETSRDVVVDMFGGFKKEFGVVAQKAFDEKWIDVYPKEGKRGGAFSHSTVPSVHPYVLLNYTDQRRDIFTLAHELGHSLHQYFSRGVGALSADTPLTTAETASVFAEMMLFDSMSKEMDKGELVGFYAAKLEDIFATVFRQIVFTNFERRVHASSDELSVEEFSNIWYEENVKMFGESVTLSEDYKLWWSYIPHFVHSPFYCYAYAFGELLVLALYRIYKDGMSDFEKRYKTFLESGGSRSPKELIALFGYDIEDVHFWDIGLREVESMLDKFLEISNA